ncbi:MAG: hypothetical protein CBC48_15440 [bacterium TMED88]|nr:hypothetical protein [Deltaproteobacteria bacterium]OUV26469.1 MAG: hypothetical protein CBC48_15440 [bacterium TMED88]
MGMASESPSPPKRCKPPSPRSVPNSAPSELEATGDGRRSAICRRVCAWCGAELARENWAQSGEAELTTWGICPSCLELREEMGGVMSSEQTPRVDQHDDEPGPSVQGADPQLASWPIEHTPISSSN